MKARQPISKMIWRMAPVVVIVAALLATTRPVGKAGTLDPAQGAGNNVHLQPNGKVIMMLSTQSAEGPLRHRGRAERRCRSEARMGLWRAPRSEQGGDGDQRLRPQDR